MKVLLRLLLLSIVCASGCDRQGPKLAEVELAIHAERPTNDIHVYISDQVWTDFGFAGNYSEHLFVSSDSLVRLPDVRSFRDTKSVSFSISHPYYESGEIALRFEPQADGTVRVFTGDDEYSSLQSCSYLRGTCLSISERSRVIKKGQRVRIDASLRFIEPLLDKEAERRKATASDYLKRSGLERYVGTFEHLSHRERASLLIHNLIEGRSWESYFMEAKRVTGDDLIEKYASYLAKFNAKYWLPGTVVDEEKLKNDYKKYIERVEAKNK